MRLRGHNQRELNDMFIHFVCLCPVALTIKLNFNILKGRRSLTIHVESDSSVLLLSWNYKEDGEQALAMPSAVLEALQLETCDANNVLARLQESLSLEQSLEQPDPETKRLIRCICMKAKTAKRLDVVKKLREIAPAGTTGKALSIHT